MIRERILFRLFFSLLLLLSFSPFCTYEPTSQIHPSVHHISIHAPREGSDQHIRLLARRQIISIHAPREGSDCQDHPPRQAREISIHAPREGSDPARRRWGSSPRHFYPRSPRGERPNFMNMLSQTSAFLSTLPARGATSMRSRWTRCWTAFLSTLPARGATACSRFWTGCETISIHAPREGSDVRIVYGFGQRRDISIHAPREGSDPISLICSRRVQHFYPRSPRGERLPSVSKADDTAHFYPRSPRGERQFPCNSPRDTYRFLSTLPARGATGIGRVQVWSKKFLSTLPARGATGRRNQLRRLSDISIHAPREGSDAQSRPTALQQQNFYPRSPRGERLRGAYT